MFNILKFAGWFLLLTSAAWSIEWRHVDVPGSGPVYSFYKSGGDVYLGMLGIRKSNDNGETYSYCNKHNVYNTTINISGYIRSVYSIYKAKNGTLYASAMDWPIMVSTDDGETWTGDKHDIFNSGECFFEAGNSVFAFDNRELFETKDNGTSWESVLSDVTFKSENAAVVDDESLVFFAQDITTSKNYLKVYNSKTSEMSEKEINIEPTFLYTENDKLLALAESTIYASADLGNNWSAQFDIKDLLKSIPQFEEDKISILGFRAKENILAVNFFASNSNTNKSEQSFAISFDSGENWEIADISDVMMYGQNYINVYDGNVYIHGIGVFVYDTNTKSFKDANYNFPVSIHYREFDDYSFCTLISNEVGNNWELKDYSGWHKINKDNQVYFTFEGTKLELDNNILDATKNGNTESLMEDISIFQVIKETEDMLLLNILDAQYKESFYLYNKYGDNLNIGNADNVDVNSNLDILYTAKDFSGKIILIKGNINDKENYDTLRPAFLDEVWQIENLSFDGDKILIETNNSIYVSTDNGANFTNVWGLEEDYFHNNPKCYKGDFYLDGTFGLLKSEDGVVWENLLENVCEGFVLNYEFTPDNHAYVYTSEGLFISKEPVSVAENNGNKSHSIDFSIFPNPTTDMLSIRYDGSIDNIEIFNLSGSSVLETQEKDINTSELMPGTYFLKIKSNEKAYFRQFVVAK